MSGVVQFMRDLVSKGMTWEDAAAFAERFEERVDLDALQPKRTANAERQARYRERKAVTNNATRNVTEDNAAPAPLPSSPQTPQQPTPTPPDINTRARGPAFEAFWKAYPNKVGKRDAEKRYAEAIKRISGPDPPGVILAGVERAKASRKWLEGVIPNPATWLHQDRWEDEPTEIIPITGRPANGPADRPHHDAKLAAKQANYARAWAGSERAIGRSGEP